ncbi:hypothetical protein AVEN_967-1 [Araneus ventricosus]|uniref:Tc1-like transposase DDE domain-containing protein n=1 Tax=Araneus ventricosus TaxID=182803 RepID=A0A4Y2CZP6_ARAVE|nr:hypothetical protein AVEN_967-1 [Araneus ventricosus]
MLWAAVCFNCQKSLALLRVQNNLKTAKRHLPVIWSFEIFDGTVDFWWTVQHDNSSIHASNSTSQWLSSNMGSVLNGLVLSPDLNYIENVWGIFTNFVYQNSKQFSSVEVLELAIEDVWFELQPQLTLLT